MSKTQSGVGTATREADIAALGVGARIGRYKVLAVLGQGGFGITYRAHDSQLDRDVAIKEFLPISLAYRDANSTVLPRTTQTAEDFAWGRDRFVREGRVLATLNDTPGVVRVYDFIESNGTAYIVMQLVHGETLENRLKKGCLSAVEIDRILWPLLDGLEQVHAAGFLHRDIKPANILLAPDGRPTLIDFGASRVAIAGRTTALTAVFTPGFAAAEQFTSAQQGPWTDIYGLAATLYAAVTGRAPPNAFDRILGDTYQPIANSAATGISPGLLAGIDAGLAVRASDRPQSIAGWRSILTLQSSDFAEATVRLDGIAKEHAHSSAKLLIPKSLSKRVRLYVATAAVGLALLGVGGYLAFAPKAERQTADVTNGAADAGAARAEAERQEVERQLAQRKAQQLESEKKAAAEVEAKRLAEEGLANAQAQREAEAKAEREEKQKAEAAARQTAEAQEREQQAAAAEAKSEAEKARAKETDKKSAEVVETGLHLSLLDRQHIQVALAALGFDAGGSDGVFGPRTRQAIASWQNARNQSSTGFLNAAQNQALLKEATSAVSKFDADQKRKVEEEAKAKEAAASAPAPAPTGTPAPDTSTSTARPNAPSGTASHEGLWFGAIDCKRLGRMSVSGIVSGGSGTLSGGNVTVRISINGDAVTVAVDGTLSGRLLGRLSGRSVLAQGSLGAVNNSDACTATLVGP